MTLPTDRDARNALPIWDGCIAYFPDVWAEVAKVSVLGNRQHNLGAKLHWDTTVSTDHLNKAMRHMLDDHGGEVMDDNGETFHLAKAVWRLSAALQLRIWARDGKDAHGNPLGGLGAKMVEKAAAAEKIYVAEGYKNTGDVPPILGITPMGDPVCKHGRTVCRVCNFGHGSFGPA